MSGTSPHVDETSGVHLENPPKNDELNCLHVAICKFRQTLCGQQQAMSQQIIAPRIVFRRLVIHESLKKWLRICKCSGTKQDDLFPFRGPTLPVEQSPDLTVAFFNTSSETSSNKVFANRPMQKHHSRIVIIDRYGNELPAVLKIIQQLSAPLPEPPQVVFFDHGFQETNQLRSFNDWLGSPGS